MKFRSSFLMILLLLFVALFSTSCSADSGAVSELKNQQAAEPRQPTPPPPAAQQQLDNASRTFVQLAKYASPAVVNIDVTKTVKSGFGPSAGQDDFFFKFFEPFGVPERNFRQRGQGSGFIIDTAGYIVTNNHVVANADRITVILKNEQKYEAEIIGTDAKTDLALLKVKDEDAKQMGALPALPFGDSDRLDVGEWVIAIGNPFGLDHTVTAGIVSAKGRVIGAGPYDDFIQTDASINPGNSGGPLINTKGEVVGINTLINASGQGIGFAIPSNMACTIIEQLKTSGSVTRGWLGVYIQNISDELAEAMGLDESRGALVSQVIDDSPADEAGFKVEDIILLFDGSPIDKNNELTMVVAATPVGKKVPVEIMRDGKSKTLQVVVGQRPDEDVKQVQKANAELGLTVGNITPQIAGALGVKPGDGVVVSQVTPGSAASEAGLRRGDVIVQVNRTRIASTAEFHKQVEKGDKGKRILLRVKREDGTFFTSLRP